MCPGSRAKIISRGRVALTFLTQPLVIEAVLEAYKAFNPFSPTRPAAELKECHLLQLFGADTSRKYLERENVTEQVDTWVPRVGTFVQS